MSKFFIKIKELFTTFTYEVKNFYNLVTKNTQNTGFYYKFFTFKFYMMLLYPFAFFYFIYFWSLIIISILIKMPNFIDYFYHDNFDFNYDIDVSYTENNTLETTIKKKITGVFVKWWDTAKHLQKKNIHSLPKNDHEVIHHFYLYKRFLYTLLKIKKDYPDFKTENWTYQFISQNNTVPNLGDSCIINTKEVEELWTSKNIGSQKVYLKDIINENDLPEGSRDAFVELPDVVFTPKGHNEADLVSRIIFECKNKEFTFMKDVKSTCTKYKKVDFVSISVQETNLNNQILAIKENNCEDKAIAICADKNKEADLSLVQTFKEDLAKNQKSHQYSNMLLHQNNEILSQTALKEPQIEKLFDENPSLINSLKVNSSASDRDERDAEIQAACIKDLKNQTKIFKEYYLKEDDSGK